MGKRGRKPKGKVNLLWSHRLAYVVGLLASDGCLSPNGRHIIFVSKDAEQIRNFKSLLRIKNKTGRSRSGYEGIKIPRVQFGDVLFYRFLLNIGLKPNKSLTIGKIHVPDTYFFDFLRGVFDGDGSTYSYWDKRWKSSFMFYVQFASASPAFIGWLQRELFRRLSVRGHITRTVGHSNLQLKYAKQEGLKVLRSMYKRARRGTYLRRKRLKINAMLDIVGERL